MMEKNKYVEELEARIEKARELLGDLEQRRRSALEELQHDEVERLEEHLEAIEHKLGDLKTAGVEAWEELKEAAEERWEKLSAWMHGRSKD